MFAAPSRIEPLEARIVPAVSVALTGVSPNFIFTVSDSDAGTTNNTVEFRLNGTQQLEWALNGGSFTNDLDSAVAGVQSATISSILNINVSMGSGNDLLTLINGGGLIDPKGTFTFDGGPGVNSLVILGTSGADSFVVTDAGVSLGGQLFSFSPHTGLNIIGAASDSIDAGGLTLDGDLTIKAPIVKVSSAVTATSLLVIADDLQVNANMSVGAGIAEFQPFNNTPITLGSKTNGALSMTDAELDRITAGVIAFGSPSSGTLTVNAPITPAGSNFLTLKSGDQIVSTGSAGITISKLALSAQRSISLLGGNDVDMLSATVQLQGESIRFADIDDLNIANSGGSANGINGPLNTAVTLSAGGLITQAPGANIVANTLQLLGSGNCLLNNPGNQVQTFSAAMTGSVSFHNSTAFVVGAVPAFSVFPATAGVSTTNSPIALETSSGSITLQQKVDAGNSTVSVSAAWSSPSSIASLIFGGSGSITGRGGVTLEADNMMLGPVNAGTAVATIRPFHTDFGIALGGSDSPTKLGLLDSELDLFTAGTLRIGRADSASNAGITVEGTITGAGGNYGSTLSLITGGTVVDSPSAALSVNALAISAGGGVALGNGLHQILNLAATCAALGPFAFTLQNGTDLTIGAPIDGIIGVTMTNPAGGGLLLGSSVAGATLTVAKPIVTQNGLIIAQFDDMTINAGITAGGSDTYVLLGPGTLNRSIAVGAIPGTLQLSPAELGLVNTATLTLGNSLTNNIVLAAPFTRPSTSTVTLWAAKGAILDATPDESPLVTAGALGVIAGGGIGVLGLEPDIDIAVNTLAFLNSGGGVVRFENTGSLNLGEVDGIFGGTSTAAGQDILVDVHGALNVTREIHSAGSVLLHTIDTLGAAEDITIAASGAVYSANLLQLRSGDNVTVAPGAALVTTGATLQILVDSESADPGVGGQFSSGGYLAVAGNVVLTGGADGDNLSITAAASADWGLVVSGGGGNDTFTFIDGRNAAGARVTFEPTGPTSGHVGAGFGDVLLGGNNSISYEGLEEFVFKAGAGPDSFFMTPAQANGTHFKIEADAPTSSLPGDALHLNLLNFPGAKHTVLGLGDGQISGPGLGTISFSGIESQTGALASVVDLSLLPYGNDGTADFIDVRRVLVAGTAMTEVRVNNALVLRTAEENVPSLTIIGSGDSDFLTISETTAGLPHFVDVAAGSHTNVAFTASEPTPAFTGLEFTGGGGYNFVSVNLSSARSMSLYPDTMFVDSGVASLAGALAFSYRNVTNFRVDGAGGTLTYDASAAAAVSSLTLLDEGIFGDGLNQLSCDGGLQTTVFSGFRSLVVTGSIGAADFTVDSLDNGTNANGVTLRSVTFDGGDIFGADVSNDTFTVSNIPSGMDVALLGRAGDDVFKIGQQAGGTVHILGGTGTDSVSFANAGGGVTLDLTKLGVAQVASGGAVEFMDAPEAFTGSAYADRLHIGGVAFTQSIVGGDGADTLTIDAHNHFTKLRRTSLTGGTVTMPGLSPVIFASTEKVIFENSGSALGAGGTESAAFGSATGYTVGKGPTAFDFGDFNGDGVLDMVVLNGKANNMSVLLGSKEGIYSAPTTFATGGKNPLDLVIADMNLDGVLDLLVLNSGSSNLVFLRGNGAGGFLAQQTFATVPKPTALALGAIDGDPWLDAVVVNGAGKMSLFMNGAGGSGFGEAVTRSTGGKGAVDVGFGDFNGDGKTDIAVLHTKSNTLTVHTGDGLGGFADTLQNTKILPKATELVITDFNGDRVGDVAVSYAASRFVSVLLGQRSGEDAPFTTQLRIATPSAYAARTLTNTDINGDGNMDLAMTSANGAAVRVLLGSGTGLFGATRSIDLGPDPARIASYLMLTDLNGDGGVDIALAHNKAGEVSVLLRTPGV